MKKVLLTIAAVALLALPASAQDHVFSLWADEGMTTCEVATTGPYQPFHVFVFLQPGLDGAFAAEYKMVVPAGHFSSTKTVNPVCSEATIGEWIGAPGISVSFLTCQTELFWIVDFTFLAPDTNPGHYMLTLNDNSQFLGVAICPGDRPMVDGLAYNYLGFNDGCVVGTEESSWGAIKSMME